MLKALRAVARFFQDTIGWNRIGVVISLAIIGVALYVLAHMLRDIDVAEVIRAVKATEWSHIAASAAFVACAYFTLTFYDWFALRTIGRPHVPYRVAALAGFSSYSVGHNVGATVFTGGAVRYRIYSHYGLTAVEVAKICFIAGLTFWLGNIAILGLGITLDPYAAGLITHLPELPNRIIGIGLLVVLVCYVTWIWTAPRQIGRGGWNVQLPNGPTTLLQICIGIADLSFCALAMYMLHAGCAALRASDHRGGVHHRDPARLRQPFAGRPGRFRRRHAGRLASVQQGRAAGRSAAVPAAVLSHAVHARADPVGDP